MKFEQPPAPAPEEEQIDTPERAFEKYLNGFRLTADDLRGKRVVDIGCGDEALFVRRALDQGLDVIGVDPNLDPSLRKEGRLIRAKLGDLPVLDIDLALSYAVIGTHAGADPRSSLPALMDRLSDNGEIRLYPYPRSETLKGIQQSQKDIDEGVAALGENVEVRVEDVDTVRLPNNETYVNSVLIIRKRGKREAE